jgi:hypothetical protein
MTVVSLGNPAHPHQKALGKLNKARSGLRAAQVAARSAKHAQNEAVINAIIAGNDNQLNTAVVQKAQSALGLSSDKANNFVNRAVNAAKSAPKGSRTQAFVNPV